MAERADIRRPGAHLRVVRAVLRLEGVIRNTKGVMQLENADLRLKRANKAGEG